MTSNMKWDFKHQKNPMVSCCLFFGNSEGHDRLIQTTALIPPSPPSPPPPRHHHPFPTTPPIRILTSFQNRFLFGFRLQPMMVATSCFWTLAYRLEWDETSASASLPPYFSLAQTFIISLVAKFKELRLYGVEAGWGVGERVGGGVSFFSVFLLTIVNEEERFAGKLQAHVCL